MKVARLIIAGCLGGQDLGQAKPAVLRKFREWDWRVLVFGHFSAIAICRSYFRMRAPDCGIKQAHG